MKFRRLRSDAHRQKELERDNLSGRNEARLNSTDCVISENRHLHLQGRMTMNTLLVVQTAQVIHVGFAFLEF